MRHAIDRAFANAPASSRDLLRLVVDSGRALLDGQDGAQSGRIVSMQAAPHAADNASADRAADDAPRAAARSPRDTLVRIVLIGAAAFVAYKVLRGAKSFAWTLFGFAMMWFWVGGGRWW